MSLPVAVFLLSLVLSVATQSDDEKALALANRRLSEELRAWEGARLQAKRSAHQIEARALNQFKNCYFSPIQCVLMERRR